MHLSANGDLACSLVRSCECGVWVSCGREKESINTTEMCVYIHDKEGKKRLMNFPLHLRRRGAAVPAGGGGSADAAGAARQCGQREDAGWAPEDRPRPVTSRHGV